MAQEWWSNAPVVSNTPPSRGSDIYIPPAVDAAEEARKARDLQLKEEAAQRAAAGEARAQAEFEGTGGKPTEAQQKTGTLLTRIKGGFADIQAVRARNPEAQEAGLGETISRSVFGEGLLTRKISGADRRIVTDAQRDVLDALLTLGTGAAYNAEQLEGQTLSYFPQYGDSPEEVQTKNQRLQRLIESAKINAGPKWAEVETAIAPFMPKAAAKEGEAPKLQVAEGETFSTDQDIAIATELNSLWKGGATIEQLNQRSIELTGKPFPAETIAILRENGRAVNITPASSGQREAGGPGPLAAIGAGLLRGATANLGEEAVGVIDPTAAAKLQAASEYAQSEFPLTAMGSELVGGVLSPLARAGNLAGGVTNPIAREAISGATYGMLYGAGEADPNAGLMERLPGAALGGALGGIGGAAGGRIAQAIDARAAAGGAPTQAVQAAQDLNIPVMTTDVAPPSTFVGRGAQQAGERIPFAGTAGAREAQQTARKEAVTELLTDYGVGDPVLAEKVAASLSQTRRAEIDKYTKMKREVIEPLSSAGAVPVTGATKAIDDEIARLERISPDGFRPAVAILQRWKSDLAGKTLDDIEVLRRQVGEAFAAPELSAVAGEAQKSLNRIYGPLRDDMAAFIKDNGAPRDLVKWQVANKRLAEGMQELGKSALKSVLRDAEQTPEAVWRLLFSNKPSDVAALYRNLGPQGKAAARAAIIDKVFRDGGGRLDEVTPEKFLRDVRKQANQVRIFFSGDEAKRLEGLIEALKLTSRAGEAPVMTNSGQQVYLPVGIAGLADIFGTGGAALGSGAAIGLMARAYESGAVRNAIMRLQNAKPVEKNKAAQNVIAALRSSFAQAGGNAAPLAPTVSPEPVQ